MMNTTFIRALQPADWPQVADIYQQGIHTGLATFETQVPTWEVWNSRHLPFARLVTGSVENADVINGWAALSPVSVREVYRGVAEVSIYIRPAAGGQGLGTQLLQALISESEQQGIWTLTSVTFAANTASRALHQRCGFREVGYRERIAQRDGIWHDTILFERRSQTLGI